MRYRRRRTITLVYAVVGMLMGATSLSAEVAKLTPQFWDALFDAKAREIKGFQGTFTHNTLGNGTWSIELAIDYGSGQLNGKALRSEENRHPFALVWVRNEEKEWVGQLETNEDVPGSWQVKVTSTGRNDYFPDPIKKQLLGIAVMERVLIPMHLIMKASPAIPPGAQVQFVDQARNEETGLYDVSYAAVQDGNTIATVVYAVDLSDGIRIVEVTATVHVGIGASQSLVWKASNHKKIGELWFPMVVTEECRDFAGRIIDKWSVQFQSVSLNPDFPPDAFTFEPPFASLVINESGQSYRVGYKNPNAPLGHDENDTRALDAELARARKQSTTQRAK